MLNQNSIDQLFFHFALFGQLGLTICTGSAFPPLFHCRCFIVFEAAFDSDALENGTLR